MIRKRRRTRLLPGFGLMLVGLVLLAGCGYSNPYVVRDSGNRIGTQRLYTAIWPNHTSELGFESLVFQAINSWFKKSDLITMVRTQETATFILDGEIVAIDMPGKTYGRHDQAVEAGIVLTLRYSLRQAGIPQPLWDEPRLILEDSYLIEGNAEQTRGNKQRALARISEDLAEHVYLRTLAVQGR